MSQGSLPPVSLELEISAPPSARVGERVPVTLRLHNPSPQPAEAHFLGRQIAFDIVVEAQDGTLVWRRLAGKVLPGILQVRVLAPDETMEWRDHWVPHAPGTYQLHGLLPSDAPQPLRSPRVRVHVR